MTRRILLAHILGVPVEEFLTPPATGVAAAMLLSFVTLTSGLWRQWRKPSR
ncbi:MAG: hypothetical protein WCC84_13915 [Candidatus Cybelea sp.]